MQDKKRIRGVKASRTKLDNAMHVSGIKTQARLAQKIAEIEELESVPKDMVNRVFRGQPVDPQTLSRVARALNVESYSLYLSKDENDLNYLNLSKESKSPIEPRQHTSRIIILIVLLILLLGIVFFVQQKESDQEKTFQINNNVEIELVLVSINDSILKPLAKKIQDKLPKQFKISHSSILKHSSKLSAWELPEELNVDYVLNVSTEYKSNITTVFIDIFSQNQKQLVFSDAWIGKTIDGRFDEIATFSVNKIKQLFGLGDSSSPVLVFKREAVLEYVKGQYIRIDGAITRTTINQSLVHFQTAIDIEPNYINAHASLCATKSDAFFLTRNMNKLKIAIKQCEALEFIAQSNAAYNRAMGSLFRRIGDLEKAIIYLEKSIELSSSSESAYRALALSQFSLGSKNRDQALMKKSLETIDTLITKSPFSWKALNSKAQIQYFMGNVVGALDSQEKSVAISSNVTSLTNLAAFNFCGGTMLRAKEIYEQMLHLKESPLINTYNLAAVYSMFLENKKAASLSEEYITKLKKTGAKVSVDPLVGLADIYNNMAEYDKALNLYQAAYKQIETERLNKTTSPLNKAYLIFIEIAIATLNNKKVSSDELILFEKKLVTLESTGNNPSILSLLIFSWDNLGNEGKAKMLYKNLVPQCKAMAETPLFAQFK
ncbi:MAG: hypothetical protein COA86_07720 [Kangiella sp.]|nr:MAG: hypothetical protein COA86_07720 [Kangiella sp.]